LRRVPTSIGVATGAVKAKAVAAAVRGGFVNTLIVDSFLAEAVLAEAEAKGMSRVVRQKGAEIAPLTG